ncbi:MAG TPA: prepilin-type N-terminal cleavage/methylation domain-containing protein [Longimicrobiales bacterium]
MIGRAGFSLVELIVALTILAVTLLGLAGAAAVAHRSFLAAAAVERGTDAAALVLDSLLREPAPVSGTRSDPRAVLRWTIRDDSVGTHIDLLLDVPDGPRTRTLAFSALHHVR